MQAADQITSHNCMGRQGEVSRSMVVVSTSLDQRSRQWQREVADLIKLYRRCWFIVIRQEEINPGWDSMQLFSLRMSSVLFLCKTDYCDQGFPANCQLPCFSEDQWIGNEMKRCHALGQLINLLIPYKDFYCLSLPPVESTTYHGVFPDF